MGSIITHIYSGFYSLNDDTHGLILEFLGKKSYCAYGAIDKRCNQIYLSKNWPKETFLFGYAPLSVIQNKCARRLRWRNRLFLSFGVLFYNRRDVLEWAFLKQQEHPYILNTIFNTAVKVGRLDILNEIHDRSTKDALDLDNHILSLVARKGKLDTLKWLDTRSYLVDYQIKTCAKSAARGGQLNVLLWLQTKHPFDEGMKRECAESAAKSGKLNILEWLHEKKIPFDSWTINEAAEGGHLHVLEWLIDNGCSFNEYTFGYAIYGGHVHVLEWLRGRDNNFPWDKRCYENAAYGYGGHLHILEWLRDNECPRGDAKIDYCEEELRDDVVIWLRNNGFSMFQYSDVEYDSEDEYESHY